MNLVKLQDTKLEHRNLLHFYTQTTKNQEQRLRKKIPFIIASKRIKYLVINLSEGFPGVSDNREPT